MVERKKSYAQLIESLVKLNTEQINQCDRESQIYEKRREKNMERLAQIDSLLKSLQDKSSENQALKEKAEQLEAQNQQKTQELEG